MCPEHFEDHFVTCKSSGRRVRVAGAETLLKCIEQQTRKAKEYCEVRFADDDHLSESDLTTMWESSGLQILLLKAAYKSLTSSPDDCIIVGNVEELRFEVCSQCDSGRLAAKLQEKFVKPLRSKAFSIEEAVVFEEFLFMGSLEDKSRHASESDDGKAL